MDTRLIDKVITYNNGDPLRIQHLLKVYTFAKIIAKEEHIDEDKQFILDTTCLLHDIAIRYCEDKFGHCNGKLQEEYGGDIAREILSSLDYQKDVIDRVSFLIEHHHTYNEVDDIDYQILLEADALVNGFEDDMKEEALIAFRDKVFKTKSGIKIMNTMFNLEDKNEEV